MELQDVFYVMGIIYMSITFILLIAVVTAVFVIKHKIHMIQKNIEDKLHTFLDVVHAGQAIVDKAKQTFGKGK